MKVTIGRRELLAALGGAAAANGDYPAAFSRYQDLRYLRTARVQIMAKVYGEIYHANAVVRELRNKVLREWAGQGGIDMSWLYGEQPELPLVRSVPQPATTRLVS